MEINTAKYNLLIKKHKDKIYGYAFFMMKNKMDADDITQEVFIKIWRNIDKFNLLSAKAWIFRTTYNLCIDYIRKQKRANEIFNYNEENTWNLKANVNIDEDPFMKTHINFMDNKIKEAIQKLPEKLRSILIFYEIQNMKYKEISKVLNLPVNTVKVYLMRAREKLRKELMEYEPQDVF